MIRLLMNSDKKKVLGYLYQEPNYNIFPIGDIETFGLECEFQRVYGEFDEAGNYLSILLRYRENAIYYSHNIYFNTEYVEIFKKDPFDFFSGKTELIELIYPFLTGFKRRKSYFCFAKSLKQKSAFNQDIIKVVRTEDECERLYDLLVTIDEFGIHKKDKKSFVEGKMKSMEMGIALYIEDNGQMVSTVATTAETTKNAMVVAVATLKDFRKKGYASMLMSSLMEYYFEAKKKELCLFYDNPDAGKIYIRLGFEPIGTWDMCERNS